MCMGRADRDSKIALSSRLLTVLVLRVSLQLGRQEQVTAFGKIQTQHLIHVSKALALEGPRFCLEKDSSVAPSANAWTVHWMFSGTFV